MTRTAPKAPVCAAAPAWAEATLPARVMPEPAVSTPETWPDCRAWASRGAGNPASAWRPARLEAMAEAGRAWLRVWLNAWPSASTVWVAPWLPALGSTWTWLRNSESGCLLVAGVEASPYCIWNFPPGKAWSMAFAAAWASPAWASLAWAWAGAAAAWATAGVLEALAAWPAAVADGPALAGWLEPAAAAAPAVSGPAAAWAAPP